MARHWVPKYKVKCECGWKGMRARNTRHYPCPRCRVGIVTFVELEPRWQRGYKAR